VSQPPVHLPELRRGPQDDWVLLAPMRSLRTDRIDRLQRECPFCPGNEYLTPPSLLALTEDGATGAWFVRVVENRFPLLAGSATRVEPTRLPLFQAAPAVGVHEVAIETPHHEQEMALRTPEQLSLTFRAWQERVRALHARKDLRHVVVFKNCGEEAGTSLAHPHSQIVALTRIPQAVLRRSRKARAFFERSGKCAVCETSQLEAQLRERIVLESEGFLAYAPFAASSEALVRVTPLEHSPAFTDASAASLLLLSRHLRLLLSMLDSAFSSPAFNLVLVMPPRTILHDPAQHWYLDLIPRLSRPGGFEIATGLGVNTLLPEEAAKIYRKTRLHLESPHRDGNNSSDESDLQWMRLVTRPLRNQLDE